MSKTEKILIAGVGNELRQDDAFGIEFVRAWCTTMPKSDQINTMEVGIAGIHLVQELHAGYDTLVLVDAVDYNRAPGTISIEEVEELSDIEQMPLDQKREFLADMHYTNPTRAMMLAKALKVLPEKVYILGCQSARHDDFDIGMSDEVTAAIPIAINELNKWITSQPATATTV
jgi:hydrogenase maturation protease